MIRSCPLSIVFEVLRSNIRSTCGFGLVYRDSSDGLGWMENNG